MNKDVYKPTREMADPGPYDVRADNSWWGWLDGCHGSAPFRLGLIPFRLILTLTPFLTLFLTLHIR